MVNLDNNYRKPIFFAVALHTVLLAALLFHFATKSNHFATQPAVNIINAIVINQNTMPSVSTPAPAKPVEKPQPLKPQQQQQKTEEVKVEPQKIEPQKVEQQQKQPQQAAEALVTQQAELKKQQQENAVEHKRLIAQQMQQELAAEEKKTKAKQKLTAKKAAEQSAKQMMQQELAASESTNTDAKPAAAQSAQNQGEIDKYKTLIIQAISNKWIVPEDLAKGLEAKLLVTLAPGGMVVNVKVIKSSGDETLDRSAETAVYKASPLPVPEDSALFGKFRTINLIVRPEGILTGG